MKETEGREYRSQRRNSLSRCVYSRNDDLEGEDDDEHELPAAVPITTISGMKRTRSVERVKAETERGHQEEPSLASLPIFSQEFPSGSSAAGTTSSARSMLFVDVEPNSSGGTTTTTTSILAPATRQFPSNNNNNNFKDNVNQYQSSRPASSSLFGAVMKNLGSASNKLSKSSLPSSNCNAFSDEHATSTPAKQNPARGSHKTDIFSPGGFQLQDVINGFGNSPFCYKSNPFGTPASTSNTTSSQQSLSLDSSPNRTLEWHECNVDSHALHFIDWTIQSALELEYSPAILQHVDASVQHQAFCQFVANLNRRQPPQQLLQFSRERSAAVAWEASTLFWQHPATYPLPPYSFGAASAAATRSTKKLGESRRKGENLLVEKSAFFSNSAVASNSSMPPPTRKPIVDLTRRKPKPAKGATAATITATSSYLQTRSLEWQEAFRSLFMSWMEQIRQLNCRPTTCRVEDAELFVKEISDLYFYATAKGHTVLFRVGVDTSSLNAEYVSGENKSPRFVPEILLSSSTLELRDKLRSMGVELRLLDSWHGLKRGVFEEEVLTRSLQPVDNFAKQKQPDSSPSIKAELVELRRAQVFGQTVGADVSVRVPSRAGGAHNLPSRSPKRIPPLLLTGLDDCAAFFEIYYNTLGNIGAVNIQRNWKANEVMHDVPLLLCRKLGPFLHSTIKTVRSTVRTSKANELPDSTVLDLQGYILPCAVRDLICASVEFLSANEVSHGAEEDISNATSEEENIVGAHHFTIKPTPFIGEETDGNYPAGTIGSHCSKGMNGDYSLLHQSFDNSGTHYCRHDEILKLAVWDLQRPNSLAYRLEQGSTSVFSLSR